MSDTEAAVFHSSLPLETKLERARMELLDLSARNRLLHIPRFSKSAKTIDVVDERSVEIFRLLVRENRAFSFLAGRPDRSGETAEGDGVEEEDDGSAAVLAQPEEEDGPDERGVFARHADTRLPALYLGQVTGIVANISVPILKTGKTTLAFYPDRILALQGSAVGAVDYGRLNAVSEFVRFIEEEALPKDAKVISKTWKYVNKNGSPDRRFKDNRECMRLAKSPCPRAGERVAGDCAQADGFQRCGSRSSVRLAG